MKAWILAGISDIRSSRYPLELVDLPKPFPRQNEILIKISVCGICHTEIDEIEGRTPPPQYPVIPGHQIIGHVESQDYSCSRFRTGDRVGVGWIHASCGGCSFCGEGNENICSDFVATGRDANGGYAEYMTITEPFAFAIPPVFSDAEAAPLLCAGAIGYRSLRLTGLKDGQKLGLTGFGASAHLVLKMVRYQFPSSKVFVFARSEKERAFAKKLGAAWAGEIRGIAPEPLHAVIDTTPAWKPVIESLNNLAPGGRLVINAIRKEDTDRDELLKLDYSSHLWLEKEIKTVANVSRRDIAEFLELAARILIKPEVQEYDFTDANRALLELKEGKIQGAKVLRIS